MERPAAGETVSPAARPFMGVKLHDFTIPELVDTIAAGVPGARQRPMVVGNVNVHALNLAHSDPDFRRILNAQDYVFCDGYGILWGARFLGQQLRQRMTPPDWVDLMFARGVREGHTFYLIGDSEKVLSAFRSRVEEAFPGIRVLGHRNGYFDHFGAEGEALVAELNALRPDIVLVGMGMPLQEKWIDRFLPRLAGGIYLPVGALYRWYVGEERRAPRWVTDNGLEWAARLLSNPRHVWRRYLVGNPLYLARLARAWWGRRRT